MFYRLGSVEESRPVAAIVWTRYGVDTAVGGAAGSNPSTTLSRVTSRWASRCCRNGCPVLSELNDCASASWSWQPGSWCVWSSRHAQFVEQHDLQLLGETGDLLADHAP